MRVGIVINRFDPQIGGAELWTHRYAHWLLEQDCEVHVIARSFATSSATRRLFHVPLANVRSRLKFATLAAEAAKKLSLDVVHDMGVGYAADIIHPHGGLSAAVQQRSLASSSGFWRSARQWTSRWSRRRREMAEIVRRQVEHPSALLVAVSQMVANDFSQVANFPKHRLRVIHNGVDLPRYQSHTQLRSKMRASLGIGDNEVLLVFVGNNFKLKGLATLLQATSKLARHGLPVKLCVIGRDRVEVWRRHSGQLQIADRVSFHTDVIDVAPFYAAGDIFALPSFYDSCSLSVLEAMAAGLPVVTSSTNGAAELLSDGENGFILPSASDPVELGRQLELLVSSRQLRQTIALRGTQTIQSQSQCDNFRQVFALYSEVLKSGKTSSGLGHRPLERSASTGICRPQNQQRIA